VDTSPALLLLLLLLVAAAAAGVALLLLWVLLEVVPLVAAGSCCFADAAAVGSPAQPRAVVAMQDDELVMKVAQFQRALCNLAFPYPVVKQPITCAPVQYSFIVLEHVPWLLFEP
jgi:hypothetical protein